MSNPATNEIYVVLGYRRWPAGVHATRQAAEKQAKYLIEMSGDSRYTVEAFVPTESEASDA